MTQRELKFRVWDNGRKEWVHGPGNEVNLFGETIVFGEILRRPDDTSVSLDELNDLVALQYSGLKDKHGKEIYEKDLIRWHDDIFRVEYDGGGFKGENVTQNIPGYLSWEHFSASEKVGDAYTTPELVDPKMIEHGNS